MTFYLTYQSRDDRILTTRVRAKDAEHAEINWLAKHPNTVVLDVVQA